MRFHPDSNQIAIQDALNGVSQNTLSREDLMSFLDSGHDHHPESWKATMEFGLGGIIVSEDHGGSGLGLFEGALCMEIIGKCADPGSIIGQMVLGVLAEKIVEAGIYEDVLVGLVNGQSIATLAFGENWNPDSWSVSFSNNCLRGQVEFVPAGQSANLILVGTEGGGLALVRGRDGIDVTVHKSTDRTRLMSRMAFDDAEAVQLCAPGDPLVQRVFDAALILTAADSLGGAQYCADLSVEYAKEREQFGKPIGQFQAIKHQLADMMMGVESARGFVWYAAYAWDQNLLDTSRMAALAKAHLCDRFVDAARQSIAVHGGIGYTWEYGLNIWFRRALHNAAFLGASSFHRARAADLAGW